MVGVSITRVSMMGFSMIGLIIDDSGDGIGIGFKIVD